MKVDVVVVGAGFAGLVLAERISSQLGKTCLVVDKRDHIGGNAHDEYDQAGVLIHTYGPHYFRTDSDRVLEYLSRFTLWRAASYNILSCTDGKLFNFPVNLNTFEQLIGRRSTAEEFRRYLAAKRLHIIEPKNSEEVVLSQVGEELYEKFFKGYTMKQWKRHPTQLSASVCGRIPIRTNRDNRYFNQKFQAIPASGYHKMFEGILAAAKRAHVILRTDFRELVPSVEFKHMIYTGPIDAYYGYCYGKLPYRSLQFERESFGPDSPALKGRDGAKPSFFQRAVQVNYPNDHAFTRIVEVKHVTGQQCENTTITREYPRDEGDPYYPVPAPDSARIYQKYRKRADQERNVTFIGRLAEYRYYNMDEVVTAALNKFEELKYRLVASEAVSLASSMSGIP